MPAPYQPDLQSLRFYLNEVACLPALQRLPRFQRLGEGLIDAVLDEGEKFARTVLAPLNRVGDTHGCVRSADGNVRTPPGFAEAYQHYVDAGWGTVCVPVEVGGQGLPQVVRTALDEMLHGANMAFALCPLLTQGAIDLLIHHGSTEQKDTYLARLITGEWTGTMCMTEPEAGSDVGAVRTIAEPHPDGTYYLRGSKIFITYGEHDMAANIVHFVLARLPDAPPGVKGLSLFAVPKFLVEPDGTLRERNGVECVSIEHKLGIHGSPTAVLQFGSIIPAVGTLVGKPNGGIHAMFTMMNAARLSVGLQGIGVAAHACQLATTYAYQRVQGKRPGASELCAIVHHPDVTRMVLSMDAEVHSLRALALYASRLMDLSQAHPDEPTRAFAADMVNVLIPIIKAHSTARGSYVCDTALQVHGGMGYIEETGIAQLLRDVRISMIYEGTNGIQAQDLVMRKIRLREGEVVRALITEMIEFAQSIQQPTHDAQLQFFGTQLHDAVRQLEVATLSLLQQHQQADSNPALLLGMQTQASLYLTFFGTVLQTYMLAVSALRATSEQYGQAWASACRNRADFFCRQHVPYCAAHAQIILGH